MTKSVNYDSISYSYNQRYSMNPMDEVGEQLLALAESLHANRVLEAGCGTGHWLEILSRQAGGAFGLDLSQGMLEQAQLAGARGLTCGRGTQLPFASGSFDLVFCVNALHHFGDAHSFIKEAARVLRRGGVVAVIGMNPHRRGEDTWYVYHYMPQSLATDLARFTSWGRLADWMLAEGFTQFEYKPVHVKMDVWKGREVFSDPFLKKDSTSQLVLLSQEEYQAGLERMEADIQAAEAVGREILFTNDLVIGMLTARLQ